MSDHYQAVYDAIRSRFHCSIDGDQIAHSIAANFFAAGQQATQAAYDAQHTEAERQRPSVLFRPTLLRDGARRWRVRYDDSDLIVYGDSPDAAMRAFDEAWVTQTPAVEIRDGKVVERE